MVRRTIVAAVTVGALGAGAMGFVVTNAFATTTSSNAPVAAATSAAGTNSASPRLTVAQRKAKRRAALLARRDAKVIRSGLVGKVVSDASAGGAFGQGQLVIAQPDGSNFTFALTNRSHAFTVQGLGKAPVQGAATSIPTGEVVTVHGAQIENGVWWASLIRESGFTAA